MSDHEQRLRDFADEGLSHDRTIPCDVRARVDALLPPAKQNECGMFLARCTFGRRVELEAEQGAPSLLVPVWECQIHEDYAAFALDGSHRRACYLAPRAGIGLDRGLFDTRHGEPLKVCASVSSWLRAGCEAVLAIDWVHFAQWLNRTGVKSIVAPDEPQRLLIERNLGQALRPPRVTVLRPQALGSAAE